MPDRPTHQLTLSESLNFLVTNRIPRRWSTLFMGWFSRIEHPLVARVSIATWKAFVDALRLEEAEATDFPSMHACFTRRLKPGARPTGTAAHPGDATGSDRLATVASTGALLESGQLQSLHDLPMADTRTDHRPDPRALEKLLAPLPIRDFLATYADRRALLIPGGADKFASLGFDVAQFFEAAERLDPGGNRLKAAGKAANEAERYIAIQPQQARGLFDAGLTVCAAGLSDAHPALGAFAEGVRFALSIPDLRFNAYLSPDGSGFNLHYDVQPIFLIQIAGAKRWWYSAEPVTPMPRRYSSAWEHKPELDSLEQTVLTPGDVLYLPAFTWHRARADGFSLGITLGTKGAHNEPLRTTLDQAPCFGPWPECGPQPPLDPNEIRGEAVPDAARAYLEAQLAWLRRYAADLTLEDLWTTWVRQLQVPLGPRVSLADDHLTSEDQLVPETGFPVYVTPLSDGGVRIDRATRSTRFEAGTAVAVKRILARREPFSVADGVAEIGRDGFTRTESRRLLRDLVSLGALRREPA